MNWKCPSCQSSNVAEVDASATGVVHRYCGSCGARVSLDPARGVAFLNRDAETTQPPPRATGKHGIGRPILVLMHGPKVGAELPLPVGRVRIGGEGGDWDFPGEGLAPVHFQIDYLMGRCYVRDLTGGEQGLTVNAKATAYAELRNGDQIRAGRATFLFLTIYRDAPGERHGDDAAVRDDETCRTRPAEESAWEIATEAGPDEPVAATVLVPKDRTELPSASVSVEIVSGPEQGKVIPLLFASNVIGRGMCEIPLADPLCSQRHAEVGRLPDGTHFLKDLASSNGTSLNGRQVHYSPLHGGDEIRIGDTVLRFVEG